MASSLEAGAAYEYITPPDGVRLTGFAGRARGNTGVRDEIRAGTLYLEAGGNAVVIVTLDILGLSPEDDHRLRLSIAGGTGVNADSVLLACSHTHSGPATMNVRATGAKETEWTEIVLERATRAAIRARAEAGPARAFRGEGLCFANTNRRLKTERGIALAPFPDGPCDPVCRALRFETGNGAATLIQYEMHPVSLGGQNLQVSADWVAHLREKVEAISGGQALFLQGCCGDVNPRGRGEDACRAAGLDLAGSILSIPIRSQPVEVEVIAAGAVPVRIPVRPIPAEAELKATIESSRARMERFGDAPESLSAYQLAEADRDWAIACGRRRSDGTADTPMEANVSAIRVGETTLIGLPGEIFSTIGAEIRERIPGAWSIGYANGNLGYLYTDRDLAAGGYEVDVAYRLYGEQQAGPGTADALVRAAVAAASLTAR